MAGLGVQLGRLLDGEGILVVRRTVATVRVRSRLFAAHGVMIPRRASTSRRLSPPATGLSGAMRRTSTGFADYCETDIVNTSGLRHELFRARLSKKELESSAANLRDYIQHTATRSPFLMAYCAPIK